MDQNVPPADRVDVVTLLGQQHDTIRDLFDQVELATPSTRAQAFQPLVRLLAVHETGEEIVVHPAVRSCGAEGVAIVQARLEEEDQSKKALAHLEGMDTASGDFLQAFQELRAAVERHAELEEREELPLLVRSKDLDELREMADLLLTAESIAPTHAHSFAPEGQLANLLTGPFLSMVDRVRDILRDAPRTARSDD